MIPALRPLVDDRRFQNLILALIVLNAITLGLETWPPAMQAAGGLILALDRIALVIFTVEVGLRILAHGLRFFRDPWSIFDFVVVAIALISGVASRRSIDQRAIGSVLSRPVRR